MTLNIAGSLLAIATIALLAYFSWSLFNREVSMNNRDAVMLVIGVILAKYSDLIAFFFGSSSTAKKQSETIDKLADTTKAAQNVALPTPPANVTIAPGQTATVEATDGNQ